MLLRLAVFGLLALGLGGFGTVAWLATRPLPEAPALPTETVLPPPPPAHHFVLAVAGPVRAGTLLKPEDLVVQDLPIPPPGAQDDAPATRAALFGGMLRRSLVAGEPLLAADVMRPGDHGFLAAVLGPNMRAASVAVDAVSGSAGLIWPGDHIDLILTQTLDDSTLPAGHRVAAETVLSGVRVIAIDQLLARGVAPAVDPVGTSRTVTFEVTAQQAERIAVATRIGRLSLAVRSADAGEVPDRPPVVTTMWGGDVSPALGNAIRPTAGGPMMRLFQGVADSKEFHF